MCIVHVFLTSNKSFIAPEQLARTLLRANEERDVFVQLRGKRTVWKHSGNCPIPKSVSAKFRRGDRFGT